MAGLHEVCYQPSDDKGNREATTKLVQLQSALCTCHLAHHPISCSVIRKTRRCRTSKHQSMSDVKAHCLCPMASCAALSCAWFCRYRRLYNAAIKDRAVTYAWFFLMYLIHIAFCVWSAVSPPLPGANDWSHTGFIACIKAFNASKFVGVLYTIGGVLWALEALWSLWVLKTVCSPVSTSMTTIDKQHH